MYTVSDTILWPSASWPFTRCDPLVQSVSPRNHILTGQNSPAANQKLPFVLFLELTTQQNGLYQVKEHNKLYQKMVSEVCTFLFEVTFDFGEM